MKNRKLFVVTVSIAIVLIIGVAGALSLLKPQVNIIQGEIDASSVKISSKLAGRLDTIFVKKGQRVEKGESLFILSTPEITAKYRQALAAKLAAIAQYDKAEAGSRVQTIEGAREMFNKAQAGFELAQKNYIRIRNLHDSGVVSDQKLDEALANFKSMNSTNKAAMLQYKLAQEGAQKEDIMAAKYLVDRAEGAVEEVESYLADSKQFSPIDGEVSSIIAEQGELVGSGYPIISIVDIENPWVAFNVKETLLPKFKIGTKFRAFIPALNATYELVVSEVAVQAQYATWSATRSTGEFDIRTFEVIARPVTKISDIRIGMTAVVDLDKM